MTDMPDYKAAGQKAFIGAYGGVGRFKTHDAVDAAIEAAVQADRAARLSAAPAPTYRHKKRGTTYRLIGFGTFVALDDAKDEEDVYFSEVAPDVWHVKYAFASRAEAEWARVQCAHKLEHGTVVAIYKSLDDDYFWVRPREEFEDGRFELVEAAAPSPAVAQPVAVKGLVWEQCSSIRDMVFWRARSVAGIYLVRPAKGRWIVQRKTLGATVELLGTHADSNEAKAAAQADYEQRIRSVLADPAVAVKPTQPSLDDVKAAIRKGLTDNLTDSVSMERWDADMLLAGCQHYRNKGYDKPEAAADILATDAANAVMALYAALRSPPAGEGTDK